MPKVKVIYNREGCIGAGACCAVCPKYWKMAPDNKAHLLGSVQNPETKNYELTVKTNDAEEARLIKESADSCPVQVIKVEEE